MACCSSDDGSGTCSPDGLDPATLELIALGASVAGHCQPCLSYHITRARELGVAPEHIQTAIAVGQMVEKGALSAMRSFAEEALSGEAAPASEGCCGGGSGQGCCGS